jgi:hypothetical protein
MCLARSQAGGPVPSGPPAFFVAAAALLGLAVLAAPALEFAGRELSRLPALPSLPPNVVTNLARSADLFHDTMFTRMNAEIERLDLLLAQCGTNALPVPKSRFRLGLYLDAKGGDDGEFNFDPELEADVRLPNFERRLRAFVTSSRLEDLPGADPGEERRDLRIGLRETLERLNVDLEAGVKTRWLPVGFAEAKWRHRWTAGDWNLYPSQKVFWRTDDGFGEVTGLVADRWMRERYIARWVVAGRWGEDTDGLEWEQSVILGYGSELVDPAKKGKVIGIKDVARGIAARASAFGHFSDKAGRLDTWRVTGLWRQPLYRKWLYLEVTPGIEFRREDNWAGVPLIRAGLDSLFWGLGDR